MLRVLSAICKIISDGFSNWILLREPNAHLDQASRTLVTCASCVTICKGSQSDRSLRPWQDLRKNASRPLHFSGKSQSPSKPCKPCHSQRHWICRRYLFLQLRRKQNPLRAVCRHPELKVMLQYLSMARQDLVGSSLSNSRY